MRITRSACAITALVSLITVSAVAESFNAGDLLNISDALPSPAPPSFSVPGVMRINATSGAKTVLYTGPIHKTNYANYDPSRQRVIAYASAGGLLAIDANGGAAPLPTPPSIIDGPLAPSGDGRLFLVHNSDPIIYLTMANVWKTLHDVNGTTPLVLPAGFLCRSAIFDTGTNSLIICRDGLGGMNEFLRLHLSADGTRIVEPVIVKTQALIDFGAAVGGISSAANGQIMIELDDNNGGPQPRWWTLNPSTLQATFYAFTEGPGAAALTSGVFSNAIGFAIGLNTFNDSLIAYGPGIPSDGDVIATTVSSNIGSGESCRLVSIGGTVNGAPTNPADLNGDGHVNAADLAILLGAWGNCGACPADLNHDGVVNAADLGMMLGSWG